jgi:uncharacterized membrane protein YoaK (UPF0700 family)
VNAVVRFWHTPWLRAGLLCGIAGFVDAVGYVDLGGVFAANMTGNTVLLAMSVAQGQWANTLVYVITLTSFSAGVAVAYLLEAKHLRVPLLIEALLIMGVALVAPGKTAALVMLAGAMGLQAASMTRFGTVTISTVVVTSVIVRIVEGGVSRKKPPDIALTMPVLAAAWSAYAIGAAASVAASPLGDAILLLPVAVLLPFIFERPHPAT